MNAGPIETLRCDASSALGRIARCEAGTIAARGSACRRTLATVPARCATAAAEAAAAGARITAGPIPGACARATAAVAARSVAAAAEPAAASTCTAGARPITGPAWSARTTAGTTHSWLHQGLARQQAFALRLLAGELAGAPNGLSLLAHALLGGLFVIVPQLHLAEDALTLHLLLERLESLIDVVVANLNQQAVLSSVECHIGMKKGACSHGRTNRRPGPAHACCELLASSG